MRCSLDDSKEILRTGPEGSLASIAALAPAPDWLVQSLPGLALLALLVIGFLARGPLKRRGAKRAGEAALSRARYEADAARGDAEQERRALERLTAGAAESREVDALAERIRAIDELRARGDPDSLRRACEDAHALVAQARARRAQLVGERPATAARELLLQAGDSAASISDAEARAGALAQIARVSAFAGDLDSARATLASIDEPFERSNALREIAAVEAGRGALDLARELAAEIDDPWCSQDAWRAVAEVEAARGELARAREALERIEDPIVRANALKAIALAEAAAGDAEAAARTAESIDEPQLRSIALGEVAAAAWQATPADAQARVEAIADPLARDEARAELARVRAEVEDGSGIPQALALLERIEQPDLQDRARSALAMAQARLGRGEEALATATAIGNSLLRANVLVELARAQAERGNEEARREVLTQVLGAAGQALTPNAAYAALPLIAQVHAALGNFEQVDTTLTQIADPVHRAEALRNIVARQARLKDLANVERLIENARDPLERTYALLGAATGNLG